MTPDGVVQNYFDEFNQNNPDYEYDASVKLMWAQTDYYKAMTNLANEQKVTEKLKQKVLEKILDEKNMSHIPRVLIESMSR